MKRFRAVRLISVLILAVMVTTLFPVSVFAAKPSVSVKLPDTPVMGVGNYARDIPIEGAAVSITVGEQTWEAEGSFAWKSPDLQFKKQGKYTCVCIFTPTGSDAELISAISFKVPITVYRLNLVISEMPTVEDIPIGTELKKVKLEGGEAINWYEPELDIEGHFEFIESEEVMDEVGEYTRAIRFKPDLGRMYNPTVTTMERDAYGNFLEAYIDINVFDPNPPEEEEEIEVEVEETPKPFGDLNEEPVEETETTEPAEVTEVETTETEETEPIETETVETEPVETVETEPVETEETEPVVIEETEPAEAKAEAEATQLGYEQAESILSQPGRRVALTIKELPTAKGSAKTGERLDTLTLEGGKAVFYKAPGEAIKGHFVWADGSVKITDSEENYPVIFIPEKTEQYNPATITLERVNGKFVDAFVTVTGTGAASTETTESANTTEGPEAVTLPAESESKPAMTQLGYELADELRSAPGNRIALTIKELPTAKGSAKTGERLDTLTLEGGKAVFYKAPGEAIKGYFVWADGSVKITDTEESYPVIFIPEKTDRYNPATVTFERVNGKFIDAFVTVTGTGKAASESTESAEAVTLPAESESKPAMTQLGYELADELRSAPGNRIALTIKELPTAKGSAKTGERLDTLTLEGGKAVFYKSPGEAIKGYFVWADGSVKITDTEESYPVIFIPEKTDRYNPATVTFERVNGKFIDAFVTVKGTGEAVTEPAEATEAETVEEAPAAEPTEPAVKGTGREQAEAILTAPGTRIALTVKELPTIVGELKKGARLDTLKLEGGSAVFYKAPGQLISGHFEWMDGDELIDETGELERMVVFIPDDADSYNPATKTFERVSGGKFADAALSFTVK